MNASEIACRRHLDGQTSLADTPEADHRDQLAPGQVLLEQSHVVGPSEQVVMGREGVPA